jgi:hypothetical protein
MDTPIAARLPQDVLARLQAIRSEGGEHMSEPTSPVTPAPTTPDPTPAPTTPAA